MSPGYEALVSGVALWLDPNRALLVVEGPRAIAALNGLLSADIESLAVGEAALSFLLTARGRPVALPVVVRREEDLLLDVSRAALPGVLDHFGVYLPPRLARVSPLDDLHRVSVLGPGARSAVDAAEWPPGAIRVHRAAEDGSGVDLYVDRKLETDEIGARLAAEGVALASQTDYETWRIELGIPVYGADVTADNLPQETGLVPRAVSFDKGCYTGQEVVARIHYRGHVNRILRGVHYPEGHAGPSIAAGTELVREGRAVGTVTSACDSPRFGPIGLAYVRHELGPGDAVTAQADTSAPFIVEKLPFTLT